MNPNNKFDPQSEGEGTLEVLQPSAIGILERAAIDTQVATAHAYPRSMEKFRKQALAMATIDEETAEQCIYVRPVGKKYNPVTQKTEEEYAEGPSIRLAEIVAACYGNIRVAAQIVEQTERYVRTEGVAFDLENNYAAKSQDMAATVKRNGEPFSEGMRAVVAKASLAKAFRDAVFKVVPRAMCKPIMEAAKRVGAGQDKPLEQRRLKVQAWLNSRKIEQSRVLAALGVKEWTEVLDEHLVKLTGLKTAIVEGLPIDEAFPPIAAADPATTKTPEKTGLTQATGKPPLNNEKKEPVAPKEPAKQPVKAPEGASTPPETVKAPETKPSEQPAPQETKAPETKTAPPEDTKELAAAGLAPSTPTEPAKPAEPQATKPPFQPNASESDALQSVRLLAYGSDVTEKQIMAWAHGNKVAKENQTALGDLASTKLEKIMGTWENIVVKIREQAK